MSWLKGGQIHSPEDIYFQNEKLGWAVGNGPIDSEVGYIANTTNGGSTWDYLDIKFSAFSIATFGIAFIDSLKGFVVGETLTKTFDGGKHWYADSNSKAFGFDIEFLDDKNGWISSWGQIFRTSDGGETWEGQFDNYINYRLEKLIMLKKDKIAYVLGVNSDSNIATLFKADLSTITGIEKKEEPIPAQFSLSQNYPNPFNPTTVISFQLSTSSHVTLKIYDLLGKEVATLVDGYKQAGTYNVTFNVETLHATSLPSGVYYYRLTAGSFSETKKMTFLK
jgi:hypothetical protein